MENECSHIKVEVTDQTLETESLQICLVTISVLYVCHDLSPSLLWLAASFVWDWGGPMSFSLYQVIGTLGILK